MTITLKHIAIGVGVLIVIRYVYKKSKAKAEPFVIEERNSNASGRPSGDAIRRDSCNGVICSEGKMCSKGFCI